MLHISNQLLSFTHSLSDPNHCVNIKVPSMHIQNIVYVTVSDLFYIQNVIVSLFDW